MVGGETESQKLSHVTNELLRKNITKLPRHHSNQDTGKETVIFKTENVNNRGKMSHGNDNNMAMFENEGIQQSLCALVYT